MGNRSSSIDRRKVILLVGLSGSGKSHFIEKVTGKTGLTDGGLRPFTQKVSEFPVLLPELSDSEICLVDTPGLDSSADSLEPFRMISAWLLQLRRRNRSLAGVLYFHSIAEVRWTSTHIWMLGHFKQFCGEEWDNQICFATTMWDTVGVKEKTGPREKELQKHLASVLKREVSIQRFVNNRNSAIEILSRMVNRDADSPVLGFNAANLVRTPSMNRRKVFLLVGHTGTGKSKFIEIVTGKRLLGGGPRDNTKIPEYCVSLPEFVGSEICLVDTPGFDGTEEDFTTFKMLSNWLIQMAKGSRDLAGVFYFHRISDRWSRFHSEYLDYFQQLCEDELGKVIFTITKWEAVDEETGRQREKELRGVHLKYALERGASMQRFTNDRQSAIEILSHIIGEDSGAPPPRFNAANLVKTPSSNRQKVFLLVGPTGTGKSKFIESVTGKGLNPRDNTKMPEFCLSLSEFVGSEICLVDTPGFGGTEEDFTIFKMLSNWLIQTKKEGRDLAGVFYFHRISDHWAKIHSDHLGYFQQLCEDELGKVIFMITKWGGVDEETGRQREKELGRAHLKYALERGASIQRFTGDRQSAIETLSWMINREPDAPILGINAANLVRTPSMNRRKVFLLVGPTGTGKSKFIESVKGKKINPGDNPKMPEFCVSLSEFSGSEICLVDTPGFGGIEEDITIFKMLSNWLIQTKKEGCDLAGVFYFHRISDHWAEFHSDHLGYFQQLYEEELGKVVFTITNWEAVDEDTGRQREKELKGIHLKYALERGASIQRFTNDYRSAIKIISLGMGGGPE